MCLPNDVILFVDPGNYWIDYIEVRVSEDSELID
jgi:hypothetical protein